jgi:hypothetical protein
MRSPLNGSNLGSVLAAHFIDFHSRVEVYTLCVSYVQLYTLNFEILVTRHGIWIALVDLNG